MSASASGGPSFQRGRVLQPQEEVVRQIWALADRFRQALGEFIHSREYARALHWEHELAVFLQSWRHRGIKLGHPQQEKLRKLLVEIRRRLVSPEQLQAQRDEAVKIAALHRTWTGPIELSDPRTPEEAANTMGMRKFGHDIMRRNSPEQWLERVKEWFEKLPLSAEIRSKFWAWIAAEQRARLAAGGDAAASSSFGPPAEPDGEADWIQDERTALLRRLGEYVFKSYPTELLLAAAKNVLNFVSVPDEAREYFLEWIRGEQLWRLAMKQAAPGEQASGSDNNTEPNTDNSLAGMVRYAVRMANQYKADIERELVVLGELTDKGADEAAIAGQYARVVKSLAQYENWLTQAFLADERYVRETWAINRDEQLQTSVLSLTLTAAGLPVSAATYDAFKQHGATLDQQLRESDARLTTARNWVRATELAGQVAGIASGGVETAAAEGGKAAGKYVVKEGAKLLLREAVDIALQKLAEKGGPAGRDVAEKIQRARIAFFILRTQGGRFSGRLGARSGKNPKRAVGNTTSGSSNVPNQDTMGGKRGLTPRNAHLAGGKHPESKIPFDKDGYPDFSGVAIRTVEIKQTGNRAVDAAAANRKAGLSSTPDKYVWHHHQDGTTMQLVPKQVHKTTGHTGGVAIQKHAEGE